MSAGSEMPQTPYAEAESYVKEALGLLTSDGDVSTAPSGGDIPSPNPPAAETKDYPPAPAADADLPDKQSGTFTGYPGVSEPPAVDLNSVVSAMNAGSGIASMGDFAKALKLMKSCTCGGVVHPVMKACVQCGCNEHDMAKAMVKPVQFGSLDLADPRFATAFMNRRGV